MKTTEQTVEQTAVMEHPDMHSPHSYYAIFKQFIVSAYVDL